MKLTFLKNEEKFILIDENLEDIFIYDLNNDTIYTRSNYIYIQELKDFLEKIDIYKSLIDEKKKIDDDIIELFDEVRL